MTPDKRKGAVEIILGKMGPKVEPDEEKAETTGLEATFEEFAAAVKSGDAKAGVAAFKSLFEQCDSYEDAGEEETEE